jgi:hypothetical protein
MAIDEIGQYTMVRSSDQIQQKSMVMNEIEGRMSRFPTRGRERGCLRRI